MSTYTAEMFRAGSGARAVTGSLTVDGERLRFCAHQQDASSEPSSDEPGKPTNELVLPTRGLGCRLSGYDNRTFFFTHPDAHGAEVAVKDASIINDPVLASHTVFQEARRVGRATHHRFWGCIALLALGAVMIFGTVGTVAALLLRWILTG